MDIYLDKLELHGFKSFPEKTTLKFHKGITAVVGPNGCGKSNIVDAILWVLGEQRIKNLRGENNEDLIFNGSSSKKPLGMTEVGSYFNKKGEQVYIARRFFRTSESKYILNAKYCRNKDIQDALFEMQLGEKKYFIFEQGSIDKLISLKPTEKRILIEEAAGISQYLERKKETANKLIIAEQNLENLGILITDKNTRLRELNNQVNYVRRYRELKSKRNDYLKALIKKQFTTYQKDFNHHRAEIEKYMNQEQIIIKEISSLEKEQLNCEAQRWDTDKILKQNQKNIFEINEEILSNKNEIDKSQQKNEFLQQKHEEIQKENQSYKIEIENYEKQIQEKESETEKLKTELKKENLSYHKHNQEVSQLNHQLESLQENNSTLKQNIFNIQAEISQINNKIHDIEKKNNWTENEMLIKTNFIKELKNQINNNEIQELENNYSAHKKEQEKTESQLNQNAARFNHINEKIENLSTNLSLCKNEINSLVNQKEKYNEIRKKIIDDNSAGSSELFSELIQESIETNKKYYKALENFYYEEMDAYPIKKNQDALKDEYNKCLLKRENIEKTPSDVEMETGFIAYIRDLYKLKSLNPELYLKNGVLVNNLQNGIHISTKYGIDVVTENAEIISKDGLIIKKREKGILNVIEEIREIDKKISTLKKELEKIQKDLDTEMIKQKEFGVNIEKDKAGLKLINEKIILHQTQLDTLKKNRESNLQRVKINESEIELLAIEQKKNNDELQKCKQNRTESEKKYQSEIDKQENFHNIAKDFTDKIAKKERIFMQKENSINLLKEKLQTHNIKLKELVNNKNKLATTIQSNLEELKKLKTNKQNILLEIETLKKNITLSNSQKGDLEKQIQKQENDFESVNLNIKESTNQLNNRRKQLEDLKENRNKIEMEFSSIKKDLVQLEDLSFKELNSELKGIDSPEELINSEISELENNYETYNERFSRMRDSDRLNFSADSEYEILSKDHEFLNSQKEDIIKSIQDMNAAIKKIDEESQSSFLEAFGEIKKNFIKNFQILFEGGEAEMGLIDEDNLIETGLEIKAQPPGKKLQNLRLLSGGEKALTSLAFLFALFEYKPSPFCVFDEVDASLDESNIQRFLKFLHKLKEKTQFLIITHNFKTMEEADYIYGISMNEPGISTIYSMKMTEKNLLKSDIKEEAKNS